MAWRKTLAYKNVFLKSNKKHITCSLLIRVKCPKRLVFDDYIIFVDGVDFPKIA